MDKIQEIYQNSGYPAAQRLYDIAKKKGITVRFDLEDRQPEGEGAPFEVEGDPDLLQSMFSNLVDNAIKYSPASSQVQVRLVNEKESVVAQIRAAVLRMVIGVIAVDAVALIVLYVGHIDQRPSWRWPIFNCGVCRASCKLLAPTWPARPRPSRPADRAPAPSSPRRP